MGWGIRYVVIAAGTPDDPASEVDIECVREAVQDRTPFVVTTLSPVVSDQLTIALLRERGAL